MIFVLSVWLDNYKIVALDDVRLPKKLCGLFVMLAPGRIRYSEPPIPIAPELIATARVPAEADPAVIRTALRFGRREFDRYLRQLVGMQKLALLGEPEIAMVGCQTAIEWFLNSFLEEPEVDSKGRTRSTSVVRCLEKQPFRGLAPELKSRLKLVSHRRNDIVHGGPPDRFDIPHDEIPSSTVSEVMQVALDLYKEMQSRSRKKQTLRAFRA
jgi:hypothetical protein